MQQQLRTLRKDQSRLFEPMRNIVLISDSVGIATMYALLGAVEPIEETTRNATAAQCQQFPLVVRFPILTLLKLAVHKTPMDQFDVAFVNKQPPAPLQPGKAQTTIKGHGGFALTLMTPIFVDFFEKHRLWIKGKHGGDANAWPPLYNFARILRNFISHHAGHVHFDNKSAPPVKWHNLEYSPADEDRNVLPSDIDIGDLIVLMFEMSDGLDCDGCPLNP